MAVMAPTPAIWTMIEDAGSPGEREWRAAMAEEAATRRRARGQDGTKGVALSTRMVDGLVSCLLRLVKPGTPIEGEGTPDHVPMARDGPITADLEVGPAQLSFHLLVTLLHPIPQAVEPHDLRQIIRWDGSQTERRAA